MKGVSLAIETIIFIILAVTVLSVLLLFFTKTGGDAQTRTELLNQRDLLCGNFVQNNLKCTVGGQPQITSLLEVCGKLDAVNCPDGKNTIDSTAQSKCIQACCSLFCFGSSAKS